MSFVLRFHEDTAAYLHEKITQEKALELGPGCKMKFLKEDFGLPEFENNFSRAFGFGGVFKRMEKTKGKFIQFIVKIPAFSEHLLDELVMISASMTIATSMFEFCEIKTDAPYCQLLTLMTGTGKSIYGGRIHGNVSALMSDWLGCLNEGEKERIKDEMNEALLTVYRRITGIKRKEEDESDRRLVRISNGIFWINYPGFMCGVNPANDTSRKKGKGYDLSSHNVDGIGAQIVLLGAIGRLCRTARKNIKSHPETRVAIYFFRLLKQYQIKVFPRIFDRL